MTCRELSSFLDAYADGELDIGLTARVNEHLAGCADCRRRLAALGGLRERLRAPELRYEAPASLERRALRRPREGRGAGLFQRLGFAQLGWAAAALLLAFTFASREGLRRSAREELAEEVVSEHLRAIRTGRLYEVESSDQHTVKPWFNGKLDFSPDVRDLASAGFPLVGGRIDFLSGHEVAALVFRRNKHWINLFVWPAGEGVDGASRGSPASVAIHGFNVFNWRSRGFRYWAVSDVNPAELASFVDLYR